MARRRGGDGGGGDDSSRWLTTYGDTVTLLLAFFVMLYAVSQVDVQKFQLLLAGFQDPFKNRATVDGLLEAGPGLVGQGGQTSPMPGVEGLEILPDVPEFPGVRSEETEEVGDELLLVTQDDLREVRDSLQEVLEAFGITAEVGMELDTRGLVVSIATDDVLFPSGSPVLQPTGRELLGVIAPILNEFDNEIKVEGHTDTVPLNLNGYTNWNLSADRALAVLSLLETEHQLNPRRLSATGYGEHRPIATNEVEEGRQRNRRVELVIVAADQSALTQD